MLQNHIPLLCMKPCLVSVTVPRGPVEQIPWEALSSAVSAPEVVSKAGVHQSCRERGGWLLAGTDAGGRGSGKAEAVQKGNLNLAINQYQK